MSSRSNQNFILYKEHKKSDGSILLEIELNNSKKLNVLNLEMILSLNQKIKEWQNREELSVVFIHSVGERAFCAGGDVAEVYSLILKSRKEGIDPALAVQDFFQKEYETDYLLCNYPKPVVLWGDGIVMGGGMGLFMSASHPIVTETSFLAMPEATIGFFPDVGASHFLNQREEGKYLALTGSGLKASEACFLGLTKWAFLQKEKENIFEFLKTRSFKDKECFDSKFKELYKKPNFLDEQDNWIKSYQKEIMKALENTDLQSFFRYLKESKVEDKKWEQNRQNFLKASPTSLAVIFEQFKRSKDQDLKHLFEMELVIGMNLACNSDFPEGVRALLVDKTKDPRWNPSKIEEINSKEIHKYFESRDNWNLAFEVYKT